MKTCFRDDAFTIRGNLEVLAAFVLAESSLEEAIGMAQKLQSKALLDKVRLTTQMLNLAKAAGQVTVMLNLQSRDARQCCKANLPPVSELRRQLGMARHSMKADALADIAQDTRLKLSFDAVALSNKIQEEATDISQAMVGLWVADAADVVERLNEMIPKWEPFREQLLTNTAVADQLLSCQDFSTMNALSDCLSSMASGMKLLNADGHGVAFAPLQIKSLNDTKSLAVDTVCIAYTLATWHGAIKNQSNHMQRCTLINELKVAIAERGSTLTTELTNILVAAEKVDFAVERKDAQEEREERKEAAKKLRWK